ncbi:hypothetical protein [Myroides guanonis]|nr:hypothetical protein [Myroides guanonis]
MQTQLLTIFRIIVIFLFCTIASACDPDDRMNAKQYDYKVALENKSISAITIDGYRTLGQFGDKLETSVLVSTLSVSPKSISDIESITIPKPLGNPAFGFIYPGMQNNVDSIVLKFSNNKGYYTSSKNKEFWLKNKSSLLSISENEIIQKNEVLIYEISQEDLIMAYDLP